MDGQPIFEIERPRSATELVTATFELYRRFPFLFAALAAGVVVPYWLIVLVTTGTGPFTAHGLNITAGLILWVTQLSIVSPLISALHVHAVDDVNESRRPAIGSVALRGLKTLPVVSAAVVAAAIGSYLGAIALIVPGVILWLGWTVVAQAAALEEGGWLDALRRSRQLSRGHWLHISGTLFLAFLVLVGLAIPFSLAFRHETTSVGSFLVGILVQILGSSFMALATALLYFDLRSRLRMVDGQQLVNLDPGLPGSAPNGSASPLVEPTGHPLDPASYSDAHRPAGWFVDPATPSQMRHWSGQRQLGWSAARRRRRRRPSPTGRRTRRGIPARLRPRPGRRTRPRSSPPAIHSTPTASATRTARRAGTSSPRSRGGCATGPATMPRPAGAPGPRRPRSRPSPAGTRSTAAEAAAAASRDGVSCGAGGGGASCAA